MTVALQTAGSAILRGFFLLIGFASIPILALGALLYVVFNRDPKLAWQRLRETWLTGLLDPDLTEQIAYQERHSTPETEFRERIAREVLDFCEAGEWLRIADRVERWDQERARTPSGEPVFYTALGASVDYAKGASRGRQVSDQLCETLEALVQANPNSYALAALAAQLRLSQGWMARGDGMANSVSQKGWAVMDAAFGQAAELLAPWDAQQQNSPLLACLHFRLCDHQPDGHARAALDRTFDTWIALDPKDMNPHAEYGFKLVPRWFGAPGDLERAALRAAIAYEDIVGAAPYAVYWLDAWDDCDVPQLPDFDADLFNTALAELVDLRSTDPFVIGSLCRKAFDLTESVATIQRTCPPDSQEHAHMADMYGAISASVFEHLVPRLSAIVPSAWDDDAELALDMIAEVYRKELEAGARLEMGPEGITVLPGDSVPQA